MTYAFIGSSERSFAKDDAIHAHATTPEAADIIVYVGAPFVAQPDKRLVLVELGTECLGDHTGEDAGEEGSNVLGFARYRNGSDAPSPLVEIVRQKNTTADAIAAARHFFEAAGLKTALCSDQAGRIIDRLVRPKYNAALRFLDEGRATQKDMDLTCRLGLGYSDGPIERVIRGGLAHHYDVTQALFEVTGASGYAPARRAAVAARRREKGA